MKKDREYLQTTLSYFLVLSQNESNDSKQRLSTGKQRRQPKQLYAETTSTNPRSSTDSSYNTMHQTSPNIHGNIPIRQMDSQLQPAISTEQLYKSHATYRRTL